jgi:hypothetical protein
MRKFSRTLTVAILCVGAMSMCAEAREQDLDRFAAGQTLGDCLVKGCSIFIGTIQTVGPPQKAPGETDERRAVMTRDVDIKVDEWLYGPDRASTVQLSHATRPAMTKTSLGPWLPWEGVALDIGGKVLVARWSKEAPRPTWLGKPEDIAFVTSDQTLFPAVREIVGRHQQFKAAPNELGKIPELLDDKRDSLFAGYFLTYLMNAEAARNVDNAAILLSGLLGHKSVPAAARSDISEWLGSVFSRLAEPARRTVTETLVGLATADDPAGSDPAFATLVRLGQLKMLDVTPGLTEERRRKLVEKYRSYQAQNKTRIPELERQLGLR